MFSQCYSLISFPEINNWNNKKDKNVKNILDDCFSSLNTPFEYDKYK